MLSWASAPSNSFQDSITFTAADTASTSIMSYISLCDLTPFLLEQVRFQQNEYFKCYVQNQCCCCCRWWYVRHGQVLYTHSLFLILTVTHWGSDTNMSLSYNIIIHILLSYKGGNWWKERRKLKPKFELRETESRGHAFSHCSNLLPPSFLLLMMMFLRSKPSTEPILTFWAVLLWCSVQLLSTIHRTLIPFSRNMSSLRWQNLATHYASL